MHPPNGAREWEDSRASAVPGEGTGETLSRRRELVARCRDLNWIAGYDVAQVERIGPVLKRG